jgi:DNA-binding IclR family transcriptional regulator
MASSTKAPRKLQSMRPVPAVSRAVAILQHLAGSNDPLGVVALARATDVIPSTCLHILRVLTKEGLICVDPRTRLYTIGIEVLSLAQSYCRQNAFVRVARRRLDELANSHGCAFAAIEQQGAAHCVVVAIGDTQLGLSLRVSVGTRFPTLVSAHGLCMAAFGALPRKELRERFPALSWDRPPTFEQWLHEIEQARKSGHAVDNGRYIRGVTTIAVPIFSSRNELLGSIAAVGLSEQFGPERMGALTATIRELALEINREMSTQADALKRPSMSESPL